MRAFTTSRLVRGTLSRDRWLLWINDSNCGTKDSIPKNFASSRIPTNNVHIHVWKSRRADTSIDTMSGLEDYSLLGYNKSCFVIWQKCFRGACCLPCCLPPFSRSSLSPWRWIQPFSLTVVWKPQITCQFLLHFTWFFLTQLSWLHKDTQPCANGISEGLFFSNNMIPGTKIMLL